MRAFRRESVLYGLALIVGLAVRFAALGALPLTDTEAKWALQALGIANGTRPALGSNSAYVLLTSIVFFAYGDATNALARLMPALAGSALVLVPALFKQRLKPRAALILAFAVALEPGLVALSRQAGSSILTLTLTLAVWGFWERRRIGWTGICAGLALLSGSSLWVGLLGLILTWAIWQPFARGGQTPGQVQPRRPERREWLEALWFAVATMVLVGTLFVLAPSGVSAWLSGLPEYIGGWARASNIPVGLMAFSLAAYQPLGLILALVAAIRGWVHGGRRVRLLSIWMVVSLLLSLFYPDRQITDLGWTLIPLWALASLEVARSLNVRPEERREVLGTVALSFVILVFIWMNFLGLTRFSGLPDQAQARTWLIFGSCFLLVMSLLLVAVGWSARIARFGAIWGLMAAAAVYSFAATMGAAGLRQMPDAVDMWRPGGTLPESELLLASVNNMSDWSDLNVNAQPVTIVGISSPALQWLFRAQTLTMQDAVSPTESAPMVVAVNRDDPVLATRYRGQSFVWRRTPIWEQTGFGNWLDWTTFHQMPQQSETMILWVRNDLFLDAKPEP
jgi:hypothetical protein